MAIAALLVLYLLIYPGPVAISSSEGEATIDFSADRRFVTWPFTCVTLSWKVEFIRSVYLNGQGKVGEGIEQFCPDEDQTSPELEVILRDGTRRTYVLPIPPVSSSSDILSLSGIIVLLAGLVVAASKADWIAAFFAGRAHILGIDRNLVLLSWMLIIVVLYWLINDPVGPNWLADTLNSIRGWLMGFFSAPYQG